MLRRTCTLLALLTLTMTTAAGSRNGPPIGAPKKTVAILYFDNYTGQSDYDPLGRGISSMMISDLSVVPEIQLVERDRMQDLVREIDLQHTKYFDSTTSVKVGKMVGAEYVVVGAFHEAQPKMRIDTRVVRVATGEIVKTAQVSGDKDKFFDLEQDLANKLIDGLGVALSPEEQSRLAAQQKANRVDELSTMTNYSQALAFYDRGDYGNAAEKMARAAAGAPNSMLIRIAYNDVKRKATLSATEKAKDKIKSGIGGLIKRPPLD